MKKFLLIVLVTILGIFSQGDEQNYFDAQERLEELIYLFNKAEPKAKPHIAILIGSMGSQARKATPLLIELLGEVEDGWERRRVILALGRIGDRRAIEPLAKQLGKENGFGFPVIQALCNIGQRFRDDVVPILLENTKGLNLRLKERSIEAIGEIDSVNSNVLESLFAAFHGNFWYSRGSSFLRDESVMRAAIVKTLFKIHQRENITEQVFSLLESKDEKISNIAVSFFSDLNDFSLATEVALRLRSPEPIVRHNAAKLLWEIGTESVVPDLIDCLSDQDIMVKLYAISALGIIKPAASDTISKLMELLNEEDIDVQSRAVSSLVAIGNPAIPQVLQALAKSNFEERKNLLQVLSKLKADSAIVFPFLVDYLEKSEDKVEIVHMISYWGPEASPIVTNLLALAGSDDVNLKRKLLYTLGKIQDLRGLPFVIEALNEEETRIYALDSLESIGEASPEVITALERLSQNPNLMWRGLAAHALVKLASRKIETAPVLLAAVESEDSEIRKLAIRALAKTNWHPDLFVPALVKLLEKGQSIKEAASCLKELGEHAAPAMPKLLYFFQIDNHEATDEILQIIENLGPKAEIAIPVLIQSLKKSNWQRRYQLGNALVKIGVKAVPSLVTLYKNQDLELRETSIRLLSKLKTSDPAALDTLGLAVKDKSVTVRTTAIEALPSSLLSNEQKIRLIQESLASNDEGVQVAAIEAIGKMGNKAFPLNKNLEGYLRHSSYRIRLAAGFSLFLLGEEERMKTLILSALKLDNTLKIPTVRFLRALGREADFAIPALERLLDETIKAETELSIFVSTLKWTLKEIKGNEN